MITLRPLALSFAEQVFEIEQACFSLPWRLQAIKNELDDNPRAVYWGLFDGEKLLGYGGYWQLFDEGHITNIALHTDGRGKGFGKELLLHMMRDAFSRGVTAMTLEVRPSNTVARKLYEGFGFEQAGKRPGYYPDNAEDALVLWNYDIQKTLTQKTGG